MELNVRNKLVGNNTILVTGGAGYIGSHTSRLLCELGHSVVVLDNLSTGFEWAVPHRAKFIQGDIRDTPFVKDLILNHQIGSVMHFAAKLLVEESTRLPGQYFDNNINGTNQLLSACLSAGGVRQFVFSSTCAVYGSPTIPKVSESTPIAPTSPYGMSKAASEWLLQSTSHAHPEVNYGILRYFNVAGAHPSFEIGQATKNATQLIKVAAEVALGIRPKLHVFGTDYPTPDGTGVRDYIHVMDLAQIHIECLNYLRTTKNNAVINCGYGHGLSVMEVIESMKRVTGKEIPIEVSPRRDGDAIALFSDTTRLQSILKFNPKFDNIDEICRSTYEFERRSSLSRN